MYAPLKRPFFLPAQQHHRLGTFPELLCSYATRGSLDLSASLGTFRKLDGCAAFVLLARYQGRTVRLCKVEVRVGGVYTEAGDT